MSSTLNINVSEENSNVPVTILAINGDLDSKTYPELEAKAKEVIGNGSTNLLFDLSGINFMGSAGLRALHSISNQLKDADSGQMMLYKPSESVARVLKTLGFDQFFTIHNDELPEAIKSFQ